MQVSTQCSVGLTEMMKGKPFDSNVLTAFKEKATEVLDHASDVFRKSERSPQETDDVVRQLKDLETAVKLSVDQRGEERQTHAVASDRRLAELAKCARPAQKEALKDAPRIAAKDFSFVGSSVIHNGVRAWGAEDVTKFGGYFYGSVDSGTAKFIKDVHDLAGIFSCIGALAGPVTVTVGNFAREQADSRLQAASTTRRERDGVFTSTVASSDTQVKGSAHYDKTSTDERVLPLILDLKDRVAQASVAHGDSFEVRSSRWMTEYERKGWGVFSILRACKQGRKYEGEIYEPQKTVRIEQTLETMPGDPPHLIIPSSGTSNYEHHVYHPLPIFY